MNLSPATLVKVKNLAVSTLGGRQLFQDLNVEISHDQVAMIGPQWCWQNNTLGNIGGRSRPARSCIAHVSLFRTSSAWGLI